MAPRRRAARCGKRGRTLRGWDARLIYKKIDSTLHGNVVVEIAAAMEMTGRRRAVMAPAFSGHGAHGGGRAPLRGGRAAAVDRDQRRHRRWRTPRRRRSWNRWRGRRWKHGPNHFWPARVGWPWRWPDGWPTGMRGVRAAQPHRRGGVGPVRLFIGSAKSGDGEAGGGTRSKPVRGRSRRKDLDRAAAPRGGGFGARRWSGYARWWPPPRPASLSRAGTRRTWYFARWKWNPYG